MLFTFPKPEKFVAHVDGAPFADVSYVYGVSDEQVQIASPCAAFASEFLAAHVVEVEPTPELEEVIEVEEAEDDELPE